MENQPQPPRWLILGSAPAGYAAAVYAARANLTPTLITGMAQGGQLMTTTEVDNWPGDVNGVQGPELMQRFQEHAERFNTQIIFDHIHTARLQQKPFTLEGDSGIYTCDALIVATGASTQYIGLPSEEAFMGKGVSGCATCDGFFFRGKEVAVIGGGNSAVEDALYLTKHAKKLTIVHRRDRFRAEQILQKRLFDNPKIEVVWNSAVDEIVGTEDPRGVTDVRLRDVHSGALREIAVDGVFIAIGHSPATELFKGQLTMDAAGYIWSEPDSTRTSMPGVFAAGDVRDKTYRQAVTAAGMGCMAALDAERFLAEHGEAEAGAAESGTKAGAQEAGAQEAGAKLRVG